MFIRNFKKILNPVGFIFCLHIFWGLTGCNETKTTVRSGKVKIAVDETIAPIIASELKTFKNQSPDAHIEILNVNEIEAMKLFLADSVQLAIIPRKLTSEEDEYFKKVRQYPASTTPFAMDGLVFITHPENPDTNFTKEQIAEILRGETEKQVIFDQSNSSLLRFAKDSIAHGKLSKKLTAAGSNLKVLDYISKNKQAIGVIGYNWISNTDDDSVKILRNSIRMVGIYNEEKSKYYNLNDDVMYRLVYKRYPYRRTIYIHNREPYVGLASGFTSFLAGKEGQTIAHRHNMIPVSGLTRLVEIKEENIPEVVP